MTPPRRRDPSERPGRAWNSLLRRGTMHVLPRLDVESRLSVVIGVGTALGVACTTWTRRALVPGSERNLYFVLEFSICLAVLVPLLVVVLRRGRLGHRGATATHLGTVVLIALSALGSPAPTVREVSAISLGAIAFCSVVLVTRGATAAVTVVALVNQAVLVLHLGRAAVDAVQMLLVLTIVTVGPVIITYGLLRRLRVHGALMETYAQTDTLTGLLNRRGLYARTSALLKAVSPGGRIGVLLLDIDHFKRVNDRHGHDVGDRVIQLVAVTLQANARGVDYVGRLGGEEFVFVLNNTTRHDAEGVAERLRLAVRDADRPPDLPPITISIGLAVVGALPAEDGQELLHRVLRRADRALYQAKRAGRDRVVVNR